MDTARISVLLEPFLDQPLSQFQLEQISIYINLLLRWNARINLTSIRNEEEIVTRHFGESLFMARHLFPDVSNLENCHPERSDAVCYAHDIAESKDPYPSTSPTSPQVIDIGSGAGFPAFPLKLWAPHIHLTLIESNHKKAAFLREAARALTLTDINVLTERAEIVAASHGSQADVVTFRAVEHFQAILPTAVKLLAPNGTLALLIGSTQLSLLTTLTALRCCPPLPVPRSLARVLSISVREVL
jgi:16S rRNA (guanine527-N7)-methyltransferase